MTTIPTLQLNPELDRKALARAYRQSGRIRIQRLLSAGAPELYHYLEGAEHWIQVLNKQRGAHEIPLGDWQAPRTRKRPARPPCRTPSPACRTRNRSRFASTRARWRWW